MENKIFKLSDIEAGYLLVVKHPFGTTFNMTVLPSRSSELACCYPDGEWWPLDNFDKRTLILNGRDGEFPIVEIYGKTCNRLLLSNSTEKRELLWSRPEEPKKMTVKEICEALGYEVEIVK